MRKYESKIRDKQAEQSKKTIQLVVNTLAWEKGISHVTVRDVCQHAGVSIGTFYLHFKNKEQAMLYLYHTSDEDYIKMEFPPNATPLENLEQMMYYYVSTADLSRVDLMRQVYIAHLNYSDPYFFSKDRGLPQRLTQWVVAGQADGSIKTRDSADEITINLLRFLRGLLFDLVMRTEYLDLSTWAEGAKRAVSDYLNIFRA